MARQSLKAAFCRGGTSNAVLFNGSDLPADRETRDRIFLHVLGSPDAYGRQLDGMGGGISSLSKVVIVEPSSREDADIDYTFVQIAVKETVADYGAMCGNMSSAVGPFAVDEGIIAAKDGVATLRIHNTNTGKLFVSSFDVLGGEVVETGDFEIPGVSQTGACITLDFLDPGGAATGRLLPTGHACDILKVDGTEIRASMVDASNPVVFVRAADVGLEGTESPADLDADMALMTRLDRIRRAASVAMGMSETPEQAILSNPKIAVVSEPSAFRALDGREYEPSDSHVSVRLVSMGNFHRAITLTGAMCVAAAARVQGTLVQEIAQAAGDVLIANPSGVLPVRADVHTEANGPLVVSATTFRTQRRIMSGFVHFPESLLENAP